MDSFRPRYHNRGLLNSPPPHTQVHQGPPAHLEPTKTTSPGAPEAHDALGGRTRAPKRLYVKLEPPLGTVLGRKILLVGGIRRNQWNLLQPYGVTDNANEL